MTPLYSKLPCLARYGLLPLAVILFSCQTPSPVKQPVKPVSSSSVPEAVDQLLEDVETCRLMIAMCADLVHKLNCGDVYQSPSQTPPGQIPSRSMAVMELYETLAPLDYAATSLKMALNCGETGNARECLDQLQRELGDVARKILTVYEDYQARRDITAPPTGRGRLPTVHWDDPVREKQKKSGVNIGWQFDFTAHSPAATARVLAKARDLGVTFVTPANPLLKWNQAEPTRGQYDFSQLTQALSAAKAAGLRVRLPLSLVRGGVPDWFRASHPASVLKLTGEAIFLPEGRTLGHQRLMPVNLFDPPTREAFQDLISAAAKQCRRHGFDRNLLSISLEIPGDTIAWKDIMNGHRPRYVGSYYEMSAEIVRKAFPGVLTDLQIMEYLEASGKEDSAPLHAIDLLRHIDIATSRGDTPLIRALTAEANHFSSAARTGTPAAGAPYDLSTSSFSHGLPDSISLAWCMLNGQIWRETTIGADSVLRPDIPSPNGKAEGFRSTRWDSAFSTVLTTRHIHQLAPYLLNTKINKPAIAMYVPPLRSLPPEYNPTAEAAGWAWALGILGIPFETWGESALNGGLPARVKTLILPHAVALSDAHVKVIREFVRDGGCLITILAPGGATGPWPLESVSGCRPAVENGQLVQIRQQGVKGTWLQTSMPYETWEHSRTIPEPDTGYPRHWQRREKQTVPGQTFTLGPGARALGQYTNGYPAIIGYTRTKGKVYTFGYPFGVELGIAAGPMMRAGHISADLARNPQITGMLEWLRVFMDDIGVEAPVKVSKWREFSLPKPETAANLSLAFPKQTFQNHSPLATSLPQSGERDYSLRFSWFSSPRNDSQYLGVVNMAAANTSGRGAVYSRLLPKYYQITLPRSKAQTITDLSCGTSVQFSSDRNGLHFWTTLAPGDFTVFALNPPGRSPVVAKGDFPGLTRADLTRRLRVISSHAQKTPPLVTIHSPTDIGEWFAVNAERDLFITPGTPSFTPAVNELAQAIHDTYGNLCLVTEEDGEPVTLFPDNTLTFRPTHARILVGNEWTNNTIANYGQALSRLKRLDSSSLNGGFTATKGWPGKGRAFITLTRRKVVAENGRGVPLDTELNDEIHKRQRLLILASDPAGVYNAADALRKMTWTPPTLTNYLRTPKREAAIQEKLAACNAGSATARILSADMLPLWLPKVDSVDVKQILSAALDPNATPPGMAIHLAGALSSVPGELTAPEAPVALAHRMLEAKISAIAVFSTQPSDIPRRLTLQLNRRLNGNKVFTFIPATGETGLARVIARASESATMTIDITDEPVLILFPGLE